MFMPKRNATLYYLPLVVVKRTFYHMLTCVQGQFSPCILWLCNMCIVHLLHITIIDTVTSHVVVLGVDSTAGQVWGNHAAIYCKAFVIPMS